VEVVPVILMVIAAAIGLSVLGAGVAVLVYFLTHQKNGSEKDTD
jgi:hypothetical protein